ncbi:YitT family protein [Clostridium tetani]|uniref:Transporter n=1 Tax=Clostridium tetani (strain Massachusetts / E88) TaxID=212717 RepID=Q895E3_CLOTE|nr:YitT family protein [Clostridium tetani]AAO35897.1 transporter [Clostridium tetani E88]KGI38194.1 membrane protein [Clostridium tetani]KGI40069.1 membrane protein [Clostridium tetani ATCC 9441]KGI41856.1 membrane protein [Clostridium tetani]KGI44998.1 membrane protein [Clostridium tetani]
MKSSKYLNKLSLKNIIFIILGSLISAIGINTFIVNASLLGGGVSGLALILEYTMNIPTGYSVFLINLPLLYLSYKKMDTRFTINTIIGSVSLSIMLIITRPLQRLVVLDDILLLCIYGGILNGVGVGLSFSNQGSTGGLDIISSVIKKNHENFDIGKISFGFNFLIVLAGAFIFDIKIALYTLVSMYLTATMIDKVVKGFDKKEKLIFIITEKEEEVSQWVMEALGRGVTFLNGEGAYTAKSKKVLYCVVSLSQLPQLKQMVKQIDNHAFISILDVSEVQGKGFKKITT